MSGSRFDDVLDAARAGEGWACARLYQDLRGPVVAFLRLRGAAEPDDVASETFLEVFRSLPRFHGDGSGFRAWVFTIARRRLMDEHRRRSRRLRPTSLTAAGDRAGGDAEEDAMASLGATEVAQLLDQLTVEQREVVLLRVLADLSLEETARVTGRSVGAVKALQHRALGALRSALTDQGVSR